MRSLVILIISVVIITTKQYSQNIAFGPELGINIINVDKSEVDGNLYKIGFNSGGYFEYKFAKHFSVRAKLIYTNKSKTFYATSISSIDTSFFSELEDYSWITEYSVDTFITEVLVDYLNLDVTTHSKSNVQLNYLELPISIVADIGENFQVSAGMYASYLFGSYTTEQTIHDIPILESITALDDIPFLPYLIKGMYSGYYAPEIIKISSSESYHTFDYGLNFGITYRNKGFFTRINTSFGLSDIIEKKEEGFSVHSNKHFITQLTIGYNINDLIIKFKNSATKI